MFGHVEMNHPAPTMGQNHQTNGTRKVAVGTVKKSMESNGVRWLSRNAFQVGEGGRRFSGQESRYGSFRDVDTQLEQLP
jgi:hypothetical protein